MLQSFVARVPNTTPASTPTARKRDLSESPTLATGWAAVAPRPAPPAGRRSASERDDFTPTEEMERTSCLTLMLSVLRPRRTA